MKKLILLLLICLSQFVAHSQDRCSLTVRVENIKEIRGSIKVAIYDKEDKFLSKELVSAGKIIESNSLELTFNELGTGVYAVSIFHDENDNDRLDANFMGVPSEPYAFSNNAKGLFGPPKFEDCQFELTSEKHEITISL